MLTNKRGVSLITVLLFMLIATIAATATFKWLNSEGRSSAARLRQNEARQAALAGVESARSWMTYHGNETGAIIKQYLGEKKPVSLDGIIPSMDNANGQSYKVSVVSVDVSTTPYKVKVIAEGTSRYGTKHNESAIFKISGLYRVPSPIKKTVAKAIDYTFSYFGATTTYSGEHHSTSMLVNGNWSGNPNLVDNDLIVTGYANLSGNNVSVGGTTCIGGNLGIQNYFETKDLYVDGNAGTGNEMVKASRTIINYYPYNVTKTIVDTIVSFGVFNGTINRDAYFNGNVKLGSSADLTVKNNMTLNGTLTPDLNAKNVSILNNFCMGSNAKVDIGSVGGYSFSVGNGVWIPGHFAFNVSGDDNVDRYDHIILGEKSGAKVMIADGYSYNEYKKMRDVTKAFTENSSYNKQCISNVDNSEKIDKNGCKYVDAQSGSMNYWNKWKGEIYKPYVAVTEKAGMHYFYYNDEDTVDVAFKTFSDGGWAHYDGKTTSQPTWGHGWGWWNPSSNIKYSAPTDIGAYFVGNKQFYNFGNAHRNNYRYGNNEKKQSPYCKESGDTFRPECHVTPWFKSNGILDRNLGSEPDFECGSSAKAHCDSIWEEKEGCDGSKYKVDDILQTGYSEYEKLANTAECSKNIKELGNNTVEALNSCYKTLSENADSAALRLYNDYLVVKLEYHQLTNPSGTLNGKFIFIYEGTLGQSNFPPTADNGRVFLHLRKGTSGSLQQQNPSGRYNYFVYTEQDISELHGSKWYGSMYAVAENCAAIRNINGNVDLIYDKSIVEDMTGSAIICPASESSCGGKTTPSSSPSSSSGGSSDAWADGGFDSDFIAIGAQLSIQTESQYKNTERYPGDTVSLKPSILVLPRVVYLHQDAVGQLSDYYTVIGLNGANVQGNGSLTCAAGAPPTSGSLTAGGLLVSGKYLCSYAEGGMSSSFFVVVEGLTSETPSVHLEFPTSISLNGSEANNQTINLVIPRVSTTTSDPFTVDIYVENVNMTGWNLSVSGGSGLIEHTSSGNNKLYTYKGVPSSSEQIIPLFELATEKGAESGSMRFTLLTPDGCLLGVPSVKTFDITGSATVKRESIEAYCEKYPSNCTGEGLKYAAARNLEDCEYSGTWIEASGAGCAVAGDGNENKKWICDAGNAISTPIYLVSLTNIPYCDLFLPTENNSITSAMDDNDNPSGYTLYASLKKKSYTLRVDFKNVSTGDVIVKTKKKLTDSFTELDECTNHSEGCEYTLSAGTYVELSIDGNGDKFSYWSCSGNVCKSSRNTATSIEFVMDGNLTYTAHFSERDPHCIYSDFSDGYGIFCSTSGVQKCIDRCESASCSVNHGRYGSDPDWLVVHENNGNNKGYKEPQIVSNFLTFEPSKNNTNSKNGGQTLILAQKLAGGNGTMTANIKTIKDLIGGIGTNEFLNSGLILRSTADGSEYISLNIFAESLLRGGLQAMICHGTGSGVSSHSDCSVRKSFKTAALGLPEISDGETVLNITVTIKDNIIHVASAYNTKTLGLNKIKASVEFDLDKDWNFGRVQNAGNSYVGFKISDKDFKVGSFGWSATDFADEPCFDYPSISCSFAANYMGGLIPLDEDTYPWIGFSSWFEGKSCGETSYFYNGCDVPNSYYQSDVSAAFNKAYCKTINDEGWSSNLYGDDGLKLKSNVYKFKKEGPHGVPKENSGIAKNASVAIECDGMPQIATSCGYFNVGSLTECSTNEKMITSPIYLVANSPETIELSSIVNLRASSLHFTIERFTDLSNVVFTLIDESGVESLDRVIDLGDTKFDVNSMSDNFGFNPEKVARIRFKANESVTINSMQSSCPNAPGISDCKASYSGSQWNITSHITGTAKKCRVSSEDVTVENKFVTCSGGVFTVNDENFYNRLNGGSESEVTYSFTVDLFDDDEATLESEPASSCVATSQAYKKAGIRSCSLDGSEEIFQGSGVPAFVFSLENCPPTGCDYKVTLSDGTERVNDPAKYLNSTGSITWKPGSNVGTPLAEGTYSYMVEVLGENGTKQYETCSKSFTVKKVTPATGTCSIGSDGTLTLSASGANNGPVSVALTYNDVHGFNIGYSSLAANGSLEHSFNLNDSLENGTYVVVLSLGSGNTVTCGTYTVGGSTQNAVTLNGCPNNPDASTGSFSFTPTVEGCSEKACSWTISGGSAYISPNSGYMNGVVTVGNAAPGTTYSLTLSNGSSSDNCSITTAPAASTGTCHCADYCGIGCEGNVQMGNINDVSFNGCLFITDATRLSFNTDTEGSYWMVNGNTISEKQPCWGDSTQCSKFLNKYAKVDGGWYIRGNVGWASVRASPGYNLCAPIVAPTVECPSPISGKEVASTVSVNPVSIIGCGAGCEYTIRDDNSQVASGSAYIGGAISFTGSSEMGTKNYTLMVSNSKGSGTCPFSITYFEEKEVACGSLIHVSGQCGTKDSGGNIQGPLKLVITCTGPFDKTVGTSTADQWNPVRYVVVDNAFTGHEADVSTACDVGKTMKCTVECSW